MCLKAIGRLFNRLFYSSKEKTEPNDNNIPPTPRIIRVEVCQVSGLLPTNYCPVIEIREFEEGQEPKKFCNIHKKPSPAPKYPKDNPKPPWMPRMVCDIVDLPFNWKWRGDWTEIERVVRHLSLAGCDYIRIFATSWKFKEGQLITPFKRCDGAFNFFDPNKAWDQALKDFRSLLADYHLSLYIDLFDNCSVNKPWNPFYNNIHGLKGFYGYRRKIEDHKGKFITELKFIQRYWIKRILKHLDLGRDIVSLGNELRFPAENDITALREWAEGWGVAHAKFLLDQGVKRPICFSGSEKTAHKLFGYISKEEHPELDDNYTLSCNQIHGLGTVEHVEKEAENFSKIRLYAYTDDGVGTNPDSMVPASKRGECVKKNGEKYACSANTAERIRCVEAFINATGGVKKVKTIGFLPREIADTKLADFKPAISADIYWKLAKKLWNIDIRRKY